MKKIFTLLALAFSLNAFAQYPTLNVTLLSVWDSIQIPAEPVYAIRYNGIWGWVDPQDNKEYAIIGSSEGTHFIDISNPTTPIQRDFVAGRRNQCIWREYKTYQNYCYMVSDDGTPNSMQIIDMSYLPDSVSVVHDNNNIISRAHTLFIDGTNLYFGIPKGPAVGGQSKMAVFSLANPILPTFIRNIESDDPGADYVHDMFVRNDTIYASESYSGMHIYRWTGTAFAPLATITTYLDQGYNHSSALTGDGNTLIFCDEVPVNMQVKSLDVSNLGNLTVVDYFKSTLTTTATPHNPFIRVGDNSRAIIAYYSDGVQFFDISNPANVFRTGFIDTDPNDCPSCPSAAYQGCWGAYVDLPSGLIIASDMQRGLFVIDANGALTTTPQCDCGVPPVLTVGPNPSTNDFTLTVSGNISENVVYEVYDVTGRIIETGSFTTTQGTSCCGTYSSGSKVINAASYSDGVYFVTVKGNDFSVTQKLIKQ